MNLLGLSLMSSHFLWKICNGCKTVIYHMYYNISFTAEDLDRNDDTGNKGVKVTPVGET